MTGTTGSDERTAKHAHARQCERPENSRSSVGQTTLVDTATVEHRSVYPEFQEIPVVPSGIEVDGRFDGEAKVQRRQLPSVGLQ